MYKLLIVDDEPLVQIGLKSMLNWSDFDIELCGTAVNGEKALAIIEEQQPDIVITDIKMPVMDGLTLLKICRERYGSLPVFLILTSYEDFALAKKAITYHANDYLVKLELSPETLQVSINKALEQVQSLKQISPSSDSATLTKADMTAFRDKFFVRLLNNLFDSDEQFQLQAQQLELHFQSPMYTACFCELKTSTANENSVSQLANLNSSTLNMLNDMIQKYNPCYVFSLDIKHFVMIFYCKDEHNRYTRETLTKALNETFQMLYNYFSVNIMCCIGKTCTSPLMISESYKCAKQGFNNITQTEKIFFYDDFEEQMSPKNSFNIALFKNDLKTAFEEFDTEVLNKVLTEAIDLFKDHPTHYPQALDMASNILYLAISLLPEGEETINSIFSKSADGYRCLYTQTTVEQILNWLSFFRDSLCEILEHQKKTYKNHIVTNVKRYINSHISEKLTLNNVASVFGITPNYLSLLFKKNSDLGFSEYISKMKVERAKQYLSEGNYKVYEVADMLGFESAFYFSKVFKKIEGCSPTEYLQTKYIR